MHHDAAAADRLVEAVVIDNVFNPINLLPTGMFHSELSHFMDCVRQGIPSPKVTRQTVLTVVELLEEIASAG